MCKPIANPGPEPVTVTVNLLEISSILEMLQKYSATQQIAKVMDAAGMLRDITIGARKNGPWAVYPHDRGEGTDGILVCDCGHCIEIIPHGRDISCEQCEAEFNSAGQRLASRDQWGEETGEHPADIGNAFGSVTG
jgi:hypothetical protein